MKTNNRERKHKFIIGKRTVMVNNVERKTIIKARKENSLLTIQEQKILKRVYNREDRQLKKVGSNFTQQQRLDLIKSRNLVATAGILYSGAKPITIMQQKTLSLRIRTKELQPAIEWNSKKMTEKNKWKMNAAMGAAALTKKISLDSATRALMIELVGRHGLEFLEGKFREFENMSELEMREIDPNLSVEETENVRRGLSSKIGKAKSESGYAILVKMSRALVKRELEKMLGMEKEFTPPPKPKKATTPKPKFDLEEIKRKAAALELETAKKVIEKNRQERIGATPPFKPVKIVKDVVADNIKEKVMGKDDILFKKVDIKKAVRSEAMQGIANSVNREKRNVKNIKKLPNTPSSYKHDLVAEMEKKKNKKFKVKNARLTKFNENFEASRELGYNSGYDNEEVGLDADYYPEEDDWN